MENAKNSRSFIGNHTKIPKAVRELLMKLKSTTVSMRLASFNGDYDDDDRAGDSGYSGSGSRGDIPTEKRFKNTFKNICSILMVQSTTGDTLATTRASDITVLEATPSDIRATTGEVGWVEATGNINSNVSSSYKVNQKHNSSVSSRASRNLAFSLHYSGRVILLLMLFFSELC